MPLFNFEQDDSLFNLDCFENKFSEEKKTFEYKTSIILKYSALLHIILTLSQDTFIELADEENKTIIHDKRKDSLGFNKINYIHIQLLISKIAEGASIQEILGISTIKELISQQELFIKPQILFNLLKSCFEHNITKKNCKIDSNNISLLRRNHQIH